MCVKSIVFLLINFHIHHYFAVNLWDIQENEGEEHTFFSPFVQKEMSSKWNRLNADLHSAAPGSTMLLLRLFSGLALCIMPHSICFLGKKKQTNTTDYMASKPHGCVSQSLKLGGPRSRCRKVWCLLRGPLLRPSPWRLSQTRRFWGGTNAWYNTATVTVVSISKKGPCPLWKGKTSLESERQTSKINFYDTSST